MVSGVRSWTRLLWALLAASCLLVAPVLTLGAESDAPDPGQPGSRLLEALAYVPPDGEVVSVEFIDWAALKAQHGGDGVTSRSPLHDREAVLLEIARWEAVDTSLGLDRLASWVDAWGWDTTDLDRQLHLTASPGVPSTTVLRFRDDWDAEPFMAQLERHGFVRDDQPTFIAFEPGPEAWYGPGEEIERLFGEIFLPPGASVAPGVGLTFSHDGRTVVVSEGIGRDGFGRKVAAGAVDSDPAAVAASPFGRAAARLGEPLTALLLAGEHVCSGTGRENALLRGDAARLARSIGPLRAYEALGIGYQRTPGAAEAVGRYVFDYAGPKRAEHDLEGRATLLEQGAAARRPYRDVAFRLKEATTVGQDVVLEVEPLGDPPKALFDQVVHQDALFAICGPLPDDEPLSRRPTVDVPLFVGPATLSLSGGRGVYRWDEIRFGAHEVRVKGSVMAGRAPCSTRLAVNEEGEADGATEGGRVLDVGFAAAPGATETSGTRAEVDYATGSLRVDSSCDDWSLRLVPLEDPNLPLTLNERFYPVRGATIEQLVPQTYHVRDEWAAYARWNTSWQFWWEETATSCEVTSGSAALSANITYPKWRPPADADPVVAARWGRFMENLTTHELGHITIALQGADAIDELLDAGSSAPTCEQVERRANRAASRLHERYNRLNDRYDEETGHGLTQGTGLR